MRISKFLSTTAIVLALSAAPALASDSKLVDILNNKNQPITTDNLNQAMLDMMSGNTGTSGSDEEIKALQCEPGQPVAFDDPTTEINECNIANAAPAAGDEGGDDSSEEDNTPNDELNDPEPENEEPTPPPPVVDDKDNDCSECPPSTYIPPDRDTVGSLDLPTGDEVKLA